MRGALARGEDVNIRSGLTSPLMGAVIFRQVSIVRLLLEQPTVDLNYTVGYQTALHYAVNSDNAEIVQLLLDDPRLSAAIHKDNLGETPVMFAMRRKKVNALRQLVAHPSVDLDTRDGVLGRSLEEMAR